ncbi:MAG: hypothetical protein AUK55_00250 [Syntrophobacteraceae bacterium CG2_30_61_12]|nr:MAG: hypothetical protein AUK55_00250 [Syntrophobacteraceae bacterium CG2_30_61_12]PIU32577.1 MAG: hypothetical protein COT06_01985 [Syntrophobacteraceae bacterium CG07_land_8_20_14_0_80_61_8]
MEELRTLREYIEQGRYQDALLLVDDLEEMSREDKLNKIYSYAVVLLTHLIKRQAEQRTTRSWEVSMYQAADQIKRINKRRGSGGFYASPEELRQVMEEAFDLALKRASLEAFEGQYTERDLAAQIDQSDLIDEALRSVMKSGAAVDG